MTYALEYYGGAYPDESDVRSGVEYGVDLVGTAVIGDMAPPAPGLCIVRFVVLDRATPVQGAIVSAQIVQANPTVQAAILARIKHQGTTNADGIADLTLVRQVAFTRGDGVYLIRVKSSTGKLLHSRYVTVPDDDSIYSEELPEILGYHQ